MEAQHRGRWRELVADPRKADAALVAGCLALTALAVKTPWSTLPVPVIVAAGLVGSVAQWPRRRWPQLAVVVGAGAYALSGNPGPWLVGLYTGAAYAPRRHVWAYGVVAWVGYLGQSWIDAGQPKWSDALSATLAVGLMIAVGGYARTRWALLASLRERAERAETERGLREERARVEERTRIAREMHDVLAHKVSLIALYAGALELHAGGNARLREGTALIRGTAREALYELREVLGVLYDEPGARLVPDPPGELGETWSELATLVHASRQAGQPVELCDEAGRLPPATARVVYRTVQEALTNAHRHAPGAPTTVSVRRTGDGSVTVTVRNEPGSRAPGDLPGSGTGLVGLAERVRLVGGSLHSGPIGSDGRGGWELRAAVPWLDRRHEGQPAEVDVP